MSRVVVHYRVREMLEQVLNSAFSFFWVFVDLQVCLLVCVDLQVFYLFKFNI